MTTQAPPAPAPTPAPAAQPTGSGAGDPLESLRNETIAWGHQGDSALTQDAPTDTAEGNTPPAPDQTAAEGSTPPSDSPPAPTDAPTSSSEFQAWTQRYGGDPDRAAREAFALEQRAVAMAAEIKALKGAQPSTDPASPLAAAQPAVQPVPAQVPQAQPVQPAPSNEPPADIHNQALNYALANDAKCRDLVNKHNANLEQIKALDAEIPTLQKQIESAQLLIAHPNVDELVKDEQRQILMRAELTLASREARASKLVLDNQILDNDFTSRIGGYVSQIQQREDIRSREAAQDQDAERQATEFVGHWPAAFEQEFKALGIDAEMRSEIHDAVKVLALARPNRIDLKDLPAFMKEAVKAEHMKLDKYHRFQARAYALRKNADTSPAAPTGPAATATPNREPVTTEDQLESLRLETRRAQSARRGA